MNLSEARKLYRNGTDIVTIADLGDCEPEEVAEALGLRLEDTEYRSIWSHLDVTELRSLYEQGLTDAELAEAMACKQYIISSWREARNLPYNKGKAQAIQDQRYAQYEMLYHQGMNDGQISKEVGTSRSHVAQWRGKMGLPPAGRKPALQTTYHKEIRELYLQEKTDKEIVMTLEHLGIEDHHVKRWRQKYGKPAWRK